MIAGSKPINIIIGMNTGARIAHFAEADPIKMLTIQDRKIKPRSSGIPVNPIVLKRFAPLIARTVPSFDTEKKFVKMEMKKHMNI